MNDPDQTMGLPTIDVLEESNGASPRRAFPPKNASVSHPATGAGAESLHFEPFRFEPTVLGAIWRYRYMVAVVVILAMVAAIGYSLKPPKIYRAGASITMPQQVSLQGQQANAGQYLDSQVLLLQSQAVAKLAASIADSTLHSDALSTSNFFGNDSSLEISPPTTAAPGAYGATVIGVSFGGATPQIAQAGTNAVLQAYDQTRAATIKSQDNAVVTDLSNSIGAANAYLAKLDKEGTTVYTQSLQQQLLAQRQALISQRTQAVVNEQIDLAQQATQTTASAPAKPANHKWSLDGGIGLIIGLLVGSALAFARDSRRRRKVADRHAPSPIYGVPLIGEIPAFDARKARRSNGTVVDGLLPVAADPHSAAAEAFRFAAGSVERIRAGLCDQRLSLVLVSPCAGAAKSMAVANLALAIAEGGTRVLVVDADDTGDVTARLLPHDTSATTGLEQVLTGRQALATCIAHSQLGSAVDVLGPGLLGQGRVMGAARSAALTAMLTEAKKSFDVVLIDSPALLQSADAMEVVVAADSAVVVVSSDEPVQDHREMVERLNMIGSSIVGYIYNRASIRRGRRSLVIHGQSRLSRRRAQPQPAGQLTAGAASSQPTSLR